MTVRIAVANASSQIGGAELSLVPVLRRLREGADIVAFLPGDGPLHDELRALRIATRPLPFGSELIRASRQYGTSAGVPFAFAAARQQLAVLRALRQERPHVVYCNGFRPQLAFTAPAAILGIPVVWHVRDFLPSDVFGRAWSRLSRRAAVVIANSQATARQPLLRRANVIAIPNGIDLDRFSLRITEPDGPAVLGMAGHLTPWKGHRRFVELVAKVRERFPDVRGRIAGGDLYDTAGHDTYAGELMSSIAALGLDQAIDVRNVPPDEMPHWLGGLTVLVHCPDRPEPFGRALAEALAVGVPVVAAAGPGAEEVVGDAGIVLPLRAETAVLEAVTELLADAERRSALAAAGAKRARALFDERRYADQAAAQVLAAARRQVRVASDS